MSLPQVKVILRALQIAKSGRVRSIDELRRELNREGHPTTQIEGSAILDRLRALISKGDDPNNGEG